MFLFGQLLLPLGNDLRAFLLPFSAIVHGISKVFVGRHAKDTAVFEFLSKWDSVQQVRTKTGE